MSTLADFDASTNQNIIAGLQNVPNCMVGDGSRMFAGNPGLPYAASYGSGPLEASLFEQAVQFAATTAAAQASLHSAMPSIYSSSPSGNNNSRTNHESSHSEEGFVLDDDEDSSILSNLPNSCHDFELKELHIRLERNHSSPLIGDHSSPAVSSLLSSKCPSTEPPADPTEPEDLEVQLINECFEEQQRQNQMYQSGDLKTLFYHGSSEIDPSKVANWQGAGNPLHSSAERPVRLPYAKKLSSQDTFLSGTPHYECRPTTDGFFKFNENFKHLLTLQSEALDEKAGKESRIPSNRRRVSEPLTHTLFWNGLTTKSGDYSSEELIEPANNCENLVTEGGSHPSFGQYLRGAIPAIIAKDPTSVKSEADILSKNVIGRLFSGTTWTSLGIEAKDRSSGLAKSEQDRATRSLYMEHLNPPLYSPRHHSSLPVIEDAASKSTAVETSRLSPDVPAQSESNSGAVSSTVNRSDHVHAADDEEKDSWEDLDDTKLEQQVNALKLEVAVKPTKPLINYFAPPLMRTPPWDSTFLSHVLEAYDVPEYKVAEDVANALASTDWGNAAVKWLGRKMVFIVFGSERQARDALVFHKHQWLRLRPLSKSPVHVQEKAKEIQAQLRPARVRPKTNAVVARRMVEHTLGLRSHISKEQREAERKQLSNARAAKKNCARWDD